MQEKNNPRPRGTREWPPGVPLMCPSSIPAPVPCGPFVLFSLGRTEVQQKQSRQNTDRTQTQPGFGHDMRDVFTVCVAVGLCAGAVCRRLPKPKGQTVGSFPKGLMTLPKAIAEKWGPPGPELVFTARNAWRHPVTLSPFRQARDKARSCAVVHAAVVEPRR